MANEKKHDVESISLTATERAVLLRLVNHAYAAAEPAGDVVRYWEVISLNLELSNAENDALESLYNKIVLGF